MLIIKCARCKKKVIKYRKIGSGRVLRCFKERISKYYQQPLDGDLRCECGQLIATGSEKWYNMKQGSFIYTGKVIK